MADRYLDSGATQSSPYESAATAANALATLTALTLAADEEIWVKTTHSESPGAAQTFTATTNATPISPQRLLCVSDFATATPPVTLATGGAITTSAGAYPITFDGSWYVYGLTISSGTGGTSIADIVIGSATRNGKLTFDTCAFVLPNNASSEMLLGQGVSTSADDHVVEIINSTIKFNNTGNGIQLRNGYIYLANVSLDASGTAPTTLFENVAATFPTALIENCDFSGESWTNLINIAAASSGTVTFRNCKFPSGWGATTGTWLGPGFTVNIHNCSSGSDNYTYERHNYEGSIFVDTSIYATTNPATDGTTSFSWRMVGGNCSKFLPLYSDWINVWVDDTSTAITPSVEILVSGSGASALNDDQVWLEVDAMDTASTPLGTRTDDAAATILSSGSAQAGGTTAWTGDGYVTERTHKLAVASFTPNQKGYIRCRVALASASTIYVNPKVALS